VSIPLESLTNLMARALYATHNTLLPTVAAVAGFTATIVSAQALSHTMGLAAIPAAYSVGMGTRVLLLALALFPRITRIGRSARRAATLELLAPGWRRQEPRAHQPLRLAQIGLVFALVFLAAGTVYATGQAFNAMGPGPTTTPWLRDRAAMARPTLPATPSPTIGPPMSTPPSALVAASASASPPVKPSPVPSPSATPGNFNFDLYDKGDFVGEFKDVWCVPAAMQTSMNIMDQGADVTEATQQRLFDLAVSLGGTRNNAAEPEGWALGLTKLGYGNYQVGAQGTMAAAVHLVVKQIRLTNRPAGLIVWYGWHSWVVSGFVTTADPAMTDNYTVKSLYIEDVWYNRLSSIWGYSEPPDTSVAFKDLPKDYKIWHQAKIYPGKEGRFVYVIPTV